MRAVVQKVTKAKVTVEKQNIGQINAGFVVFLGVSLEDTYDDVKYLVEKIINLRIFEDEDDKMNLSLLDVKGELLAVSQFTLYGDCRKGRRPSFSRAAKPEVANKLYQDFVNLTKSKGVKVDTGKFRTNMLVEIYNEGPVTILLDSQKDF